MICFVKNLSEIKYFLFDKTRHLELFPLYVNKLSLKQTFLKLFLKDWLPQLYSVFIKKCMKFLCGLVDNVCDNTRSFWDFRHLKVNCNLSVKRICRRLFGKLPRNNRHCMVETFERFVLIGLLQRNVKSSRLEVFCKKCVLKIFAKLTGKNLCWSLFLIWDYRDSSAGVSCEFCEIFIIAYFAEHLGTVASEKYTLLASWKSF